MANDIWCVADIRGGKVATATYEALGAARPLADALGGKVCAFVIGDAVSGPAAGLGAYGAERVVVAEGAGFAGFVDEVYAKALAEAVAKHQPRIVLFPASAFGRSLAARAAAVAGVGLAADVTELSYDKGSDQVKGARSCGGGTYVAPLAWTAGKAAFATLRAGSFPRGQQKNGGQPEVVQAGVAPAAAKSRFKSFTAEESKEIDIGRADIIVSGGYGLGEGKHFEMLKELAHLMGGAVGASRRAVDSGWIPYRHQVGLTGRTVKPKLYIACGISGQIQHLAGMSQADTIVAINNDPKAPLMQMATFAVEGDLFQVVPALIEELKKAKH